MIKLTFMLTLAPWLRRVAAVLVLPVLAARWRGVLPPRSIWSSSRPSLVISSHSQPAIQSWKGRESVRLLSGNSILNYRWSNSPAS